MILVMLTVALTSGCAGMPDFQRMQGTMDTMAYYTGIMASNMPTMTQSTARMAAVAERMERNSNGLIAKLESKGNTMERAVQNYAQSFLDNDRALIKSLKGIRKELGELKQSIKSPARGAGGDREQDRINARLQAKLNQLEGQLATISAQIANREKMAPSSRR